MENGIGGFTPDGREYVIVLDGDRETPLPWSNVLANPGVRHGAERVGRGLYVGRQQPGKPVDAVRERSDHRSRPAKRSSCATKTTAAVWGATPGRCPRTAESGRWVIRHGAGVTHFQYAIEGLEQELAIAVAPDDPVKLSLLTLTNTSNQTRRLSVFGYVEWVLGPPRSGERRFVVSELHEPTGAILARNAYNTEFKDRVAFWRATEPPRSFTCDRADFIGRNRTLAAPAGLFREELGGQRRRRPRSLRRAADRDRDPAGRITPRRVRARSGQHRARTRPNSSRDTRRLADVDDAIARAERFWDDTLGAIQVHTPDDSFDLLVNRWLLYQALSCRIWARSGPYQPGGAFGFRDQLQDVLVAAVYATGSLSCPSRAGRVAPVRRRRRAALVASAGRTRHAHAMFRRSAVAAVRRRDLRRANRRSIAARRGRAVSRGAAARRRIRAKPTACRRCRTRPRRSSSIRFARSIAR